MGTVYIQWEDIAHITTDKTLEVETSEGQRYFGSLEPGESPAELNVRIGAATTAIRTDDVAFARPIDPTFWGKMDASIDFGLTFTQAESQTDYSLNGSARYTSRTNIFRLEVNSLLKIRGEDTTTNRQVLTGEWMRHLRWRRWFGIAVANFEHNAELNLDLRATSGYGIGRYLVQSNRWTWNAYATGLYSWEQYTGEETANNELALGLGTNVQVFIFGDHDTDVNTGFIVLPSLTTDDRYRVRLNVKLKREFLKDLYISLDLFETYDSNPPQEGAKKNDFGVTTALGWSF